MNKNTRKNITQPADWWAAWEEAAKKAGKSLSAWIGDACNARLPKADKVTLGKRNVVGKPKSS